MAMGVLHFLAAYPQVPLAMLCVFFFGIVLSSCLGKDSPAGLLSAILVNLYHVNDWATKMLEKKGCTTWIRGPWFSGVEFIFSSDPRVAKHVNSTKFSNFVRGPQFREMFETLGDGVISLDSEEWRVQRKLIADLMHQPRFMHSLHKLTHQMLERRLLPLLAHVAREKKLVDLQDVLQRFTFDIMCSLILGVDVGSLSASFPVVPFMVAFGDVERAILFRYAMPLNSWRLLRWLRVGPERKLAEGTKVINEFVHQAITARREEYLHETDTKIQDDKEAGDDAPFDLLTELIRNHMADNKGKSLDFRFLRDSTFELLIAGWQTTSLTMAWLLRMVSLHPSTESMILDELTPIADRSDVPQQQNKRAHVVAFRAKELNSCIYLNAAIHESLRLFSPVPLSAKLALEHDTLPTGQKLKPGTMVLLSLYAMGRSKNNWGEDAAVFKPGRWITKEGELREESSYKFGAFGSGPRICVGKHIGLATVRAVMASIIYNFRFSVAEGHQISVRPSVVLLMKDGLKGSLQERW